MKLSECNLLPGDICVTTDGTWIGKGIKFFESMWTQNAYYTHAFAYVGNGLIVEAEGNVRKMPVTEYDNSVVVVYRVSLTDAERQAFTVGMLSLVGDPYGYAKYPLFILDSGVSAIKRLFGNNNPSFFFTDNFSFSKDPVCSQLVAKGLYDYTSYRIKNKEGKVDEWKSFSPDYLSDDLNLPINNATIIFDNRPADKVSIPRSGKWPTVRNNHLKLNPICAVCGGKENLNVHHIQDFHQYPELELDSNNLITLCEGHVVNCHLLFGHLLNFRSININVIEDVKIWNNKIKTRP